MIFWSRLYTLCYSNGRNFVKMQVCAERLFNQKPQAVNSCIFPEKCYQCAAVSAVKKHFTFILVHVNCQNLSQIGQNVVKMQLCAERLFSQKPQAVKSCIFPEKMLSINWICAVIDCVRSLFNQKWIYQNGRNFVKMQLCGKRLFNPE